LGQEELPVAGRRGIDWWTDFMTDEPIKVMEFLHGKGSAKNFPKPTTAARILPQWLKDMPGEFANPDLGGQAMSTLKRCAPFVDAMTCGYVLPLACEVSFFMRDAANLDFAQTVQVVETQPLGQYRDAPFGNLLLVKFRNPWIVMTPPGYSTLFVPLINQHLMPFQMLAGFVETDNYYREINFPAICTMRPGQRCVLPKGMPIIQAIPIKRESWEANVSSWDEERVQAHFRAMQANVHFYKDEDWVKKNYR
jgi:hypothetical protein